MGNRPCEGRHRELQNSRLKTHIRVNPCECRYVPTDHRRPSRSFPNPNNGAIRASSGRSVARGDGARGDFDRKHQHRRLNLNMVNIEDFRSDPPTEVHRAEELRRWNAVRHDFQENERQRSAHLGPHYASYFVGDRIQRLSDPLLYCLIRTPRLGAYHVNLGLLGIAAGCKHWPK